MACNRFQQLLIISLWWVICRSYQTNDSGDGEFSKVDSHGGWRRLVISYIDAVTSLSAAAGVGLVEETAHIQDVQSYYREVFEGEEGWYNPALESSANLERRPQHYKRREKKIKSRYIISFAQTSKDEDLDRLVRTIKRVTAKSKLRLRADHIQTFRRAGRGFTATLNSKMVELIRRHPLVQEVEEDVAINVIFNQLSTMDQTKSELCNFEVPWNLDQIDQRSKHLDGKYNPNGTGKGIDVFIVDTGIRYTHQDLEGRAKYSGIDIIDHITGRTYLQGVDCNGHGTHIAGIIGGRKYGVAKGVTMYSVSSMDCNASGAISGFVHALEHVAKFASPNRKVISMSIGSKSSVALDNAVRDIVNRYGIVVVAAAGNDGDNSCSYSPPSSNMSINVGATDINDQVASFSNTGSCVQVFAPGEDVCSLSRKCDSCTAIMSGTSMACPHVTGYVALLLEMQPSLTPAQVLRKVVKQSTKGALDFRLNAAFSKNTPNRLLNVPQS